MPATQSPAPSSPSYVKDLALLFAVPLIIAAVAAAIAYIPRLMAHPSYLFIYSYCSNYSCDTTYSLSGNQIRKNKPLGPSTVNPQDSQLAVYNPATQATKQISFEEAQAYQLINSSRSPDGYTLVHASGNSGFLFWNNYSDAWLLENGLKKKSAQLSGTSSDYGTTNITFLGWIQK